MKIDISNHNLKIMGRLRPYTDREVVAYLRSSKIVVDTIPNKHKHILQILNTLNKRHKKIINNMGAKILP